MPGAPGGIPSGAPGGCTWRWTRLKEDYLLMSDRNLGEFDEGLCYKIEWEINVNLIRHFKKTDALRKGILLESKG